MPDLSFDAAIQFAADLIRIPGLSGQEIYVAQRVLQEFAALGYDEQWSDEVGNVFGLIRGNEAGPTIMLCSHLDAVDVGERESWEHDPFAGHIDELYLHGRGAMDIKGPLALQTYAAAHFIKDRIAGNILVGHTVSEERGGWGIQHFLTHGSIKPDVVIIGESTNGDICIGHRGRAEVVVEVQGVAGHASAPDRARNPIEALPLILPALRQFADRLPANDLLGRSTIAPTMLETLPRSRNVIPDRARIILDWRVLPDTTAASVVADIRSAIVQVPLPPDLAVDVRLNHEHQNAYTGASRERQMFTPGFLMQPDHRVVRAAAETIEQHTGRTPQVRPWTFATDGGHACGIHGIPCIGFAPGEERYAHTNRERLLLSSARIAYSAYPALIRDVLRVA